MLHKAVIIMGCSQETLENVSGELHWHSALTMMGHMPHASLEHTPQYGGVNQVLSVKQTLQWLKACMKTCTLSESQTAQAVAKSLQQGGHSEHKTVAPKSQCASADSECVQQLCTGSHQEAHQAAHSQQQTCEKLAHGLSGASADTQSSG